MPDFIGDDLIIGILHNIADSRGLLCPIHLLQRDAVVENFSPAASGRGQDGFQMPQKRGLSAAAVAAEQHILTFADGKRHVHNGFPDRVRIGKAQVSNFKLFHTIVSRRYMIEGTSSSAQ